MADRADAATLMRKAEKAHKTGLFNWTPDWPLALQLYEEAANAYRREGSAGAIPMVAALIGASNAAEQMSNLNTAAKHVIAASQICMANKEKTQGIDLARKGARLYHENKQARKAADELVKAATMVRDDNPDLALQLYTEAADIYEIEGQTQMAGDTFKSSTAFLIRLDRLEDALAMLMKQNQGLAAHVDEFPDAFNKNCLSICIINLALRDTNMAVQNLAAFQTIGTFLQSPEYTGGQNLIDAFQKCDVEGLTQSQTNRIFTYLDNQVTRLVRDLKIDEDAVAAAQQIKHVENPAEPEIDLT